MSWEEQMRQVAEHTAPSSLEIARTRATIARGRPRGWGLVYPSAGLALAAATVIAVGLWWQSEPEPSRVVLDARVTALGDVGVRVDGVGHADGIGGSWEIAWASGELGVEVPADGRHHVVVRTPEAEVHVVGTGFEVVRDALGTSVEVNHGQVRVVCTEGPTLSLDPGAATTCLPVTATGLLGRAGHLSDAGADPAIVLGALDAGLARGPGTEVAAELQAARIGPLIALRRSEDALAAAEAYLDSGANTRREPVRQAAAALGFAIGGCDRALPHLQALAAPTEAERARIEACSAP